MTIHFIDANIPMYVAGKAHRYKKPSTGFMLKVARGEVEALSRKLNVLRPERLND